MENNNNKTKQTAHDTPLFRETYKLYLAWYRRCQTIPKKDRFAIGQKTENLLLEMMTLVVAALCHTSGERSAKIAIAVVRRPPVAVHALRIEVANVHEVAVRVQRRFSYALPSESTTLHANGTCRACINTRALRKNQFTCARKA